MALSLALGAGAQRKKVGLVLSGGGAKGVAHIGVLKVLEEAGIPVDYIVGTSMGSIVGGLYAIGYDAATMDTLVRSQDWPFLLSDKVYRYNLPFTEKESTEKYLLSVPIRKKGGISLPSGFISGQNIYNLFSDLTIGYHDSLDFATLPIPFACVASNLVDGRDVILDKGYLPQCLRASMAIPGVFSPVREKGMVLVDGGISNNFPVDVARRMGADIIIAVNAGTPLGKSKDIHSVAGVMGQMIGILTERNVEHSKSLLTDRDILITTDLEGFNSGDFTKAAEIIEAGEKSARTHMAELRRLAVPRSSFLAWNSAREASVVPPQSRQISEVRVEGLKTVNPKSVIKSTDLDLSQPVTEEQIAQASAKIWATDDFTLVPYVFEPGPNGTQTLVWRPLEKPWGYNTIRVGGKVSTDFNQEHTFDFLVAHTMGWLNSWGGEWRNEAQIGKDSYFSTSFYQPLGAASPVFVMPEIRYESQRYDWYNGSSHPEATLKNKTLEGSLSLGLELDNSAVLTVGAGYISAQSKVAVGHVDGYESMDDNASFVEMTFRYDTLDNINFPTKGFYLDAQARRYGNMKNSAEPELTDYYLETLFPWDWGQGWVSILSAKAGSSTIPGRYPLGGLFNMSGAYYGRYSGSDMFLGRLMLQKRLQTTDIFGFPVYLGASYEMGRVQEDEWPDYFSSNDLGEWKNAMSAYVAIDSLFGPLYFALGHTSDGDSATYFFWGRPLQ